MFTGLVREVGTVEAMDRTEAGARIRVAADLARDLGDGDSVAVAGVCLTVAALGRTPRSEARGMDAGSAGPREWFEADTMNQTLSLTTLGDLRSGDRVNLEPALRASDPLGGHLVQGHVDGVAAIAAVDEDGTSRRLRVDLPAELSRYVAPHGSIALEGVSLTVAGLGTTPRSEARGMDAGSAGPREWFEVALIPETLARTTLGSVGPGDRLNVEVDLIARHLERLMQGFTERRSDG
jgi:riboflavin synthase